jgi:hypothetical protein
MSSDFCIKCDNELSVYCGPCVDAIRKELDDARASARRGADGQAVNDQHVECVGCGQEHAGWREELACLEAKLCEARAELDAAHAEVDGTASRGNERRPVPLAKRIRIALDFARTTNEV